MATRKLTNNDIAALAEQFGLSVTNNADGQPRKIKGGVPQDILAEFDAELERLRNSPPPAPGESPAGAAELPGTNARIGPRPSEIRQFGNRLLNTNQALGEAIWGAPAAIGSALKSAYETVSLDDAKRVATDPGFLRGDVSGLLSDIVKPPFDALRSWGENKNRDLHENLTRADMFPPFSAALGVAEYIDPFGIVKGIRHAGEQVAAGDIGRGLADTAVIGAQIFAPKVGRVAAQARLAKQSRPDYKRTPAVDLAERHGIELSKGERRGTGWWGRLQSVNERTSLLADAIEQRKKAGQREGIVRAGESIADDVSPTSFATDRPQFAGVHTFDDLGRLAAEAHDAAGAPYTRVRNAKAVVEMGATHPTLQSIYGALESKAKLGFSLPADQRLMNSLEALLTDPRPTMPLMGNIYQGGTELGLQDILSSMKAVQRATRTSLNPTQRGQLNKAIHTLSSQADEAATQAGVKDALGEGSKHVRRQYEVQDLRAELRKPDARGNIEGEPIHRLLTGGNKADLLTRLEGISPGQLRVHGRVLLETMLEKDTAAAALTKWKKLGDTQKQLLFGPAAKDVDSFLTLARDVGVDYNPSGTASSGALFVKMSQAFTSIGALVGGNVDTALSIASGSAATEVGQALMQKYLWRQPVMSAAIKALKIPATASNVAKQSAWLSVAVAAQREANRQNSLTTSITLPPRDGSAVVDIEALEGGVLRKEYERRYAANATRNR